MERKNDIKKQDVGNEAEREINLERSVLLDVKRERNKMKEMTKETEEEREEVEGEKK